MNDNHVVVYFFICLTIIIVLFAGDPDIHDGIVNILLKDKP